MATLTAEATVGTALSVECGHHLATYQSQKLHVTEFRKPVAIKRNSKAAEANTAQDIFDPTASSGLGAWESVLDYSQYNVTANDKQEITLASDIRPDTGSLTNTFTDSGRIGVVFDFTEYHECTPSNTTGNIVVKYTADGEGTLQLRTSNDFKAQSLDNQLYVADVYVLTDYIDETDSPKDYTTSLDNYSIDDGFVTVWFKGPGIKISNITARISCIGKARASVTPVYGNTPTIFNDVIETEEFDTATNTNERDSIITFDNIDLSAWPSTLQAEAFEVDSLTNFIGIEDIDATTYVGYVNYAPGSPFEQRKTLSSDRAQATENVNFPNLVTDYETSPPSSIQLVDNNPEDINNQSWRVGFGGKGYVEFGDHIFLPCVNRTDAEELETFPALTISVWWYGDTIPSTFFMADDADASYNVNSDFGDRSVKLTHEASDTYNVFEFSYSTGGTPPTFQNGDQSNTFGKSARNVLTAKFLLNRHINADGWNNLLISFRPHTDLEYRDILEGISHPLIMKAYLNDTAANSISGVNTPEQQGLPVTQSLANEMYIIANPDIQGIDGTQRSSFESANTILNAKYRGDGTSNNLGSTEDTQNAFYFVDNQLLDLDQQSNRNIFKNSDGTPTSNPQINGQTPKVFISGNDKTINNLGTLPITKLNVQQRNLVTETVDTVVGAAPTARIIAKENGVGWDRDVFEAQNGYPVVTYKRIAGGPLTLYQRTQLSQMGIDLAYVYPAQGTFTNGFIKTKLLLELKLTSGPVSTDAEFNITSTPNMLLRSSPTLASNFDFDTTTGKIHLFRFDPMSLDTAFTTQQSGSRLITDTVTLNTAFNITADAVFVKLATVDVNTAFTTTQTGHRRISDSTTITTPITSDFDTSGRIHIFRFDDQTLNTAFDVTAEGKIFTFEPVTLATSFDIDVTAGITNVRSGAIAVDTAFEVAVDGGVELASGTITLNTAFNTTQSGDMLRQDSDDITLATAFDFAIGTAGVVISNSKTLNTAFDFDTTTGKIHVFTFAPHTFATSLSLTETGKIHVFTFAPHTFDTAFTFTPETARIHIFRFVPRTFTIDTTFTPESGRIHLFNLPDITLNTPFTADFRGGIRQESSKTFFPIFEVDVQAPVPFGTQTFDTAFTLSQPTVEIVKQANKVTVPTQQRIRLVRPHPRTVEAERLETVTSSAVDEWQDVAQWLDFDDFASRHSISHRLSVAQNRTVACDHSTRTLMVTEVDRDDVIDVVSNTYTVPQHQKTISTTAQTRTITASHVRTVATETAGRTVDAERLT